MPGYWCAHPSTTRKTGTAPQISPTWGRVMGGDVAPAVHRLRTLGNASVRWWRCNRICEISLLFGWGCRAVRLQLVGAMVTRVVGEWIASSVHFNARWLRRKIPRKTLGVRESNSRQENLSVSTRIFVFTPRLLRRTSVGNRPMTSNSTGRTAYRLSLCPRVCAKLTVCVAWDGPYPRLSNRVRWYHLDCWPFFRFPVRCSYYTLPR